MSSRLQNTLTHNPLHQSIWRMLHLDGILLCLLLLLAAVGLFILYSASDKSLHTIEMQSAHLLFAFFILFLFAQIPPITWQRWATSIYVAGGLLLIVVLIIGHVGKGAQRWLNLFGLHLQPAELMKLAIPLILAKYFHALPLPIKTRSILIALPIIFIPALLTAKQPDLGTAILIVTAGISVLFLAGLNFKLLGGTIVGVIASLPLVWYALHDYQRQRILTFLNPERDPLGTGYHIIQSKIAIGSGGLFGKGFLHGTQSTLHFLPEHTT
ncbi:MAG: rod shape-determining protein RodA, partial [uncultured bacterium]